MTAALHRFTDAEIRGHYAAAEIEESLLGIVLSCGDAWSNTRQEHIEPALALVQVSDFTDWKYRAVWQAILDVHAAGHVPNLPAVHAELARTGAMDEYGGAVDLADWVIANSLRGDMAVSMARIVRTNALQRRLAEAAMTGDMDGIAAANQGLAALGVVETDDYPTMREAVDSYFESMGDDATRAVRTGIGGLDRVTGGFRPGNLIVVGARPGVGKSAFGLTIAYHNAIRGNVPVGFLSLEMSTHEMLQRLVAMEANIATTDARRPSEPVVSALGRIAETNLDIRRPGSSVMDVTASAGPLVRQHGCQLIIIDYLQLLSGGGRPDNRAQDIATITRELKLFAQAHEVPVMLLSQLKRDSEERSGPPRMADLAEGDAPARDADVVLLLHPDSDSNLEAVTPVDLIVAKHRNGPVGTVALNFQKKTTRFAERVWS